MSRQLCMSSDNPFPKSAVLTAGQLCPSELKGDAQRGLAFPWGLLAGDFKVVAVSEWDDVDKDFCVVNGKGEVSFG